MKAPFSAYLTNISGPLKQLLELLGRHYEYVSILATDSPGFAVRISQHAKSISRHTPTTERGVVIRLYRDGGYCEYALNDFDPQQPEETAARILADLEQQENLLKELGIAYYPTPCLKDEPAQIFVEMETGSLPEEADLASLVASLQEVSDEGMKICPDAIDTMVSAQSTHVNKMFLTAGRDLRQSYVMSEGTVVSLVARNGMNNYANEIVSGRSGPEIFAGLKPALVKTVAFAEELLDAERIEPGEYDIITSPGVSGLIAHEAFGHGVEMDMFVKKRALGAEYINQRVGSDHVTMHEGAACNPSVTGYAFDDEGTAANDVIEIQNGILKTGICDALSALRLGVQPTGNGKRQNYAHKVYTRMTNTLFEAGNDTLEDMIASISYGYLLEGVESGMEDPKHWGIQCIIKAGREIRDGKLTGRIVAPVIMTGYVPDLLNGITMLSNKSEVFGGGFCGKGYKEWVKVADGGPYMKTRGRLA